MHLYYQCQFLLKHQFFQFLHFFNSYKPNGHTTSIRRRSVEDQILTNFHIISLYFFDVISLFEKFTLFPRTFFDVIWMIEKSTLFPHTFIGVISLVQKSTFLPRTFFDEICLVDICTLFLLTFLDVILMGKNSTSFLVSCKLMKTLKEVFLVFVMLIS